MRQAKKALIAAAIVKFLEVEAEALPVEKREELQGTALFLSNIPDI